MEEKYSQDEINQAYFVQLVSSLSASAWAQLGKIASPLTGKVEKNMDQAKLTIDMLAMLEAKTTGNLTDKEQKMLEKVLFELRMNYIEEMKVTEEQPETAKETAPQESATMETRTAQGKESRDEEKPTRQKASSGVDQIAARKKRKSSTDPAGQSSR